MAALAVRPLSMLALSSGPSPSPIHGNGKALNNQASSRGSLTSCCAAGPRSSPVNIEVKPVQRPAAPPPEPLPVIHSAAFMQAKRAKPPTSSSSAVSVSQENGDDGASTSTLVPSRSRNNSRTEVDENDGLMWALKRLDQSLDELEQNPLPLQKEIYAFSKSPVGKTTSSALEAAAKLTVQAGKEAVKAAVPVAQWLGKEGAKAAVNIMAQVVAQNSKKQK